MFFVSKKSFENAVMQELHKELMRRESFERIDALEKRCADLDMRLYNLENKVNPSKHMVTQAVSGSEL